MTDPTATNDPVRDCLAEGFRALARGDTARRDRQVERARRIMEAQHATQSVDVGRDGIIDALVRTMGRELGRSLTAAERRGITEDPAGTIRSMMAAGIKPS